MAVPCGDQRDFEFARVFGLDIPPIQMPPDEWFAARGIEPTLDTDRWPEAFIGDAPYVNSANRGVDLNGMTSVADGVAAINAWLEAEGLGEAAITYKLRDWLFSRQR
jgi:leucyl-tRNA synthetase